MMSRSLSIAPPSPVRRPRRARPMPANTQPLPHAALERTRRLSALPAHPACSLPNRSGRTTCPTTPRGGCMAVERARNRPFEIAPWRAIDELQDRLRRWVFGEFVSPTPLSELMTWTPPVEMAETDDELLLSVELPGMKRQDIQVTIDDGVLTIRGEKKEEHEEKEKRYHLWERRYGAFERSFTLPRSVDPQGIKARFEDGVLKIEMPKSKQARGKRIEVEGE
nr:MAG: hypothetical protein DIU52_12940 [bacterium]